MSTAIPVLRSSYHPSHESTASAVSTTIYVLIALSANDSLVNMLCLTVPRYTGSTFSGGGDLPPSLSETVYHTCQSLSNPQYSPAPPTTSSSPSCRRGPTLVAVHQSVLSTVPPSPRTPLTDPPNVSANRSEMLPWGPLFDDYMEVTAVGDLFFNAIFTYLDSSYTGYLRSIFAFLGPRIHTAGKSNLVPPHYTQLRGCHARYVFLLMSVYLTVTSSIS
ncbi:hypothetical protein ARMSODRAFT_955819 [Armillaria solidipes]|uniref:Uncharacterized protein n=1 Tax=Armillaria solidipes TaxID=1076256 RepID=A0A2H3BHL7_9AGAR|nr:hypothetical protein ARMSODRAFT_955819 [Armillaria solidipes]